MKNKTVITAVIITVLAGAFVRSAQAGLYLQYLFNDPGNGTNIAEQTGARPFTQFAEFDVTGPTNATYVASPGKTALHFVGTDNYYFNINRASVGDAELPDSMTNAMSIAYWVRFPVDGNAYMPLVNAALNGGLASPYFGNYLQYHNGTNGVHGDSPYANRHFMAEYGTLGNDDPATVINADTWYHLTWTMILSGATRTETLYVNGIQVASASGISGAITFRSPSNPSGVGVRFGVVGNTGAGNLAGDIDQLEIYDNALSGSEVLALFNYQPIPEPTTMTLLGLGGLALLLRRRKT